MDIFRVYVNTSYTEFTTITAAQAYSAANNNAPIFFYRREVNVDEPIKVLKAIYNKWLSDYSLTSIQAANISYQLRHVTNYAVSHNHVSALTTLGSLVPSAPLTATMVTELTEALTGIYG